MKIKLLEYEAEVEWISSRQTPASVSRDSISSISVWFTFREPVGSTIGFGISIPPREYTEEQFKNIIIDVGTTSLQGIIDEHKKQKVATDKRGEQRKELNKLVADLGDRVHVPYHLDIK